MLSSQENVFAITDVNCRFLHKNERHFNDVD